MAPIAEILFEGYKQAIAEHIAPTDKLLEDLNKANSEGDVDNAARISQELFAAFSLKHEIYQLKDPVTQVLQKYGKEQTDLPLQISPVLPSTAEEEALNAAFEVVGTRKPWKYIDNARPLTIDAIVSKDSEGHFLVNHLSDIRPAVLQDKYRRDPEALSNAKSFIKSVKKGFIEGITRAAELTGRQNMAEILEAQWGQNMEGVSHEAWREVYLKIKAEYGNLSYEDFTDQVLNRFPTNWPKGGHVVAKTREPVKKEIKKKPERIKIKDILANPQSEIILSQKLLRNGVLEAIQLELLDGQRFELPGVENAAEALRDSSERIAQSREYREISKKEATVGNDIILGVLNRFKERRSGWYKLPDNLVGFNVLYEVVGKVRDDNEKFRKLTSMLYPSLEVTLDESGFIVEVHKK